MIKYISIFLVFTYILSLLVIFSSFDDVEFIDKKKENMKIIEKLDFRHYSDIFDIEYPDSLKMKLSVTDYIIDNKRIKFNATPRVLHIKNNIIYFYSSPIILWESTFRYIMFNSPFFPMYFDITIYDIDKEEIIKTYHFKGDLSSSFFTEDYAYFKIKRVGYVKAKLD